MLDGWLGRRWREGRAHLAGPGCRAAATLVLAVVASLVAPAGAFATRDEESAARKPGGRDRAPAPELIVTLALPDATRPLHPGGAAGRARALQRAKRSERVTDALERRYGFEATNRYQWALAGFSAPLTPAQRARLARDPDVASIRPARRFEVAAQVLPMGIRRVNAQPADGPAAPDVDVDVAIIDTGIGPVGGGELNVAGGINCSGDSKPADEWSDLYFSRHGTHVAGIVGARHNSLGVVGVAPGARLWSLRVFRASGYGDEATIICALDWAVATHGPGAPPDSQQIEVINMSLVGPRITGAPEACGVVSDPDPIHVAVCSAVAAGMTVVAAAGNAASNAKNYAPAGYDQVITVGAMTDFDGQPGGGAPPTCAATFFGTEVDDTYARYSNYGADVDLVAPGTCVVSTYPTADGDSTQRLTGTSMAAPHVAGAAARYLAANPGTSPEVMRDLLRVSGTLDWDASTDPDWRGPTAGRGPDRLLNVAALLSPSPGLAVWLVPSRLTASGKTSRLSARVEVQRIGGYAGAATLSLAGLPSAGATSSFTPGATLSGIAEMGRRLLLDFAPDAPDGRLSLEVEASGGGLSGTDGLRLLVDRTGPLIKGPAFRMLVRRSVSPRDAVATRVTWSASDAIGRVRKTVLQRATSGGTWRTVAKAGANGKASLDLRLGKAVGLRVRATDGLGNRSTKALRTKVAVLDPASGGLTVSGTWSKRASPRAVTGRLVVSSEKGATLSAAFSGQGVAIVAPVGPRRGSLRVRVDDRPWTTVSLREPVGSGRRIVFSRSLARGPHTLDVQVKLGPAALDAVLVLR